MQSHSKETESDSDHICKSKHSRTEREKVSNPAIVTPTYAANKKVTYKSSSTSVATVSTSGVVTGKKVGTATITATAADGSKKKTVTK